MHLTGSVRGRGGPHRAACIDGHWNPPYWDRFGWRRVRPLAIGVYRPSRPRQLREGAGAVGRHDWRHTSWSSRYARGLMRRGRRRVRARDSASGPSSAVADAVSCRSSRTEGSSELRAGQRQPRIDRSPSRIGTTWRQVADQFRSTHITFHPCLLVIGVQHEAGRGGSFTLRPRQRCSLPAGPRARGGCASCCCPAG